MYVGSVIIGQSPTVLSAIADEQVAMAVWLRPDPVRAERSFPERLDVGFDGLSLTLSDETPDWLFDEIALLGDIFGLVGAPPQWSARFETARMAAVAPFEPCTSFRLVTAYGGEALDWLFEHELGGDVFAKKQATRERIRRLPAGSVAVLRGFAPWVGDAGPGLVFREGAATPSAPQLRCVFNIV